MTTSGPAEAHEQHEPDEASSDIARVRAALAGRYSVRDVLGEGGMGTVYLGHDDTLQRDVAIKVIRADHLGGRAARERFLQEARVVAALRHPNIVSVFAAGEAEGILWFAMEYVDGESLRELITRTGPVPVERALEMVSDLASALEAAHRRDVVHRDVKPENILVERETGRVLLADFGVARALAQPSHHTGTGFIVGSPRYMSPEQIDGVGTLDGRSDLYSLALVGYELVTGKPVVKAAHPAAMLVEQLTTAAPPLRDALTAEASTPDADAGEAALAEAYADAIDGALAKDVSARWPDARSMRKVLRRAVDSRESDSVGGSDSGSDPVSQRLRAMRRDGSRRNSTQRDSTQRDGTHRRSTHNRQVLAALAVVLVCATGAVMWWRTASASAPARGLLVLPFDVPAGQVDLAWLREGAVNMLTLSLSQWRDLEVTDYERTLDVLAERQLSDVRVSLSQAQDLAATVHAGAFVLGQISPIGDSLVVVARHYVGRQSTPRTAQVTLARGDDPRRAFDQLATSLLELPSGATPVSLTAATTTNLAAYRRYLEGLRALNRWELLRADSAFSDAVVLDSTFALAWYKRGITRGWNGLTDSTPSSAEIAVRYAARLPPRDRHLVEAHRWLWTALTGREQAQKDSDFRAAIAAYSQAVALDSTSADAWYGLADGQWHYGTQNASGFALLMTSAKMGFERALQLDPSFHLAYSHLVELHRQFAQRATRWYMVDGRVLADSQVPDTARRSAAQQASARQQLSVATQWRNVDPHALHAWAAVGEALAMVGRPDSAALVMREAARQLGVTPSEGIALRASFLDFLSVSPSRSSDSARAHLQAALSQGMSWSLGARGNRHWVMGIAASSAAGLGDSELLARVMAAWRGDLKKPVTLMDTLLPWWHTLLRAGMGEPLDAAQRRSLAQVTKQIASYRQIENQLYQGPALAAYMLTQDTVHAALLLKSQPDTTAYPEVRAAMALQRGDTVTARRIRRSFTDVSRVRYSNFGLAGLRTLQRVEVLLALGEPGEALAHWQAMDPRAFNMGTVEPGLAMYVRSLPRRAELEERLGQREAAAASRRLLLQYWSADDPLTAATRRATRMALDAAR